MHDHRMRRFWLFGWISLLLVCAGCFQSAGGGLPETPISAALPTFTPYPSNTPSPIPLPTDTPVQFNPVTPSPTFQIFDVSTSVAVAASPNPNLDPIFETATAIYLNQGGQPIQVIPLDAPTLDPLLASATALVNQATATAGVPLTQTAQAMFGATLPPIFIAATNTPLSPHPQGADCVYEVQPTDRNLWRISILFGIPYTSIAQASNLVNPNLIHVGDKLIIPGCGVTGYQPPPTSIPTSSAGATAVPSSGQTYVVVQGDTLFALSLRWGTTIRAIAALNQIPNVNLIYIGQTLNIPQT